MTIVELRKQLSDLATLMDMASDKVNDAATIAQQEIYEALLERLSLFNVKNGRMTGEDLIKIIPKIEREIKSIINAKYAPSLQDYFPSFSTIDDVNTNLHKSYNELVLEKSLFTSARRSIYDQAEYFLTDAVADAYIQPTKFMLMQAATSGITIKQGEGLLRNWNSGTLPAGSRLATGRATPRLQAYAGQIAKDSIFQYNGVLQDKVAQEYGLTKGLYVGGLVEDSRPFCKHMVGLRRKIDITEIPPLLEKYPDGIIPNTTKENFPIRRGGFRCSHNWMAVK
jgi:hypothetical protein